MTSEGLGERLYHAWCNAPDCEWTREVEMHSESLAQKLLASASSIHERETGHRYQRIEVFDPEETWPGEVTDS